MVAKEYEIGHYECEDCGEEVVASHFDCPEGGRFGEKCADSSDIAQIWVTDSLPEGFRPV